MSKLVVINALLKKENCLNIGYIVINGNSVEGIFTLDYVKILNENGRLKMILAEKNFYQENSSFIQTTEYYFSGLNTTLYSPENYILSNNSEGISLNLNSKVTDENKISLIESALSLVRI